MNGLSRMRGDPHVRFLGGGGAVRRCCYPTMWQTKRNRAILPSSSYASTNAAVESSTMGALLVLLVLSTMLVRIERDQAMLEQLLSLIGIKRRLTRSESTFALIVAALVFLALFVAIDPEARIFLMFIDSFGADLFVTLCVLFFRHRLAITISILIIPILKGLYRWGPVPGFWPSKLVVRSSATWTGYAILWPAIALLFASAYSLLITAVIGDLVKRFGLF